ncbi:hypothetical protein [Salinimicrobium gaetbulicola]|uniref:Integron-associated effector binding protein n=1 Tax=Salinimicrobium gaetbulicola TaxID=999702 RepID=A0ABW3IBQ1_9FLAO
MTFILLVSCGKQKNKDTFDIGLNNKLSMVPTINQKSQTFSSDSIKVETSNEKLQIESPEIKMLEYLTLHFNRIEDSTFLKKPEWMIEKETKDTICGYVISFKEGHSFKHEQECVEWGEIVTVSFRGFTSDKVRQIVEELYKNENYDWYSNKTEYRPEKYYESVWTFKILESEASIELEFAYSWI